MSRDQKFLSLVGKRIACYRRIKDWKQKGLAQESKAMLGALATKQRMEQVLTGAWPALAGSALAEAKRSA